MLLEYDMIERSKSPLACGNVTSKKRGQLRFCSNFRYLNAVTIEDAYPIPRIDDSLSKLGDAKFFTTLDLGSAFSGKDWICTWIMLVPVENDALWLVQCHGDLSKTYGSDFDQKNEDFDQKNLMICFVDDAVIATSTLADHIDNLNDVFECIKRADLKRKL